MNLTHVDEKGRARMVDVGGKPETAREAVARCRVLMAPQTAEKLLSGALPKGDALAVARVAGIMAAKKTPDLIPLCHPLALASVEVDFATGDAAGSAASGRAALDVEARVRLTGRTGAEMEALTACAVAALTIYDMAKAVDRGMVIDELRLVRKSGGKSGLWERPDEKRRPEGEERS